MLICSVQYTYKCVNILVPVPSTVRNFESNQLILVVFVDATEFTKFKYFTAHILITYLKCLMQLILPRVIILYCHPLKWLCLDTRLV